MPRWDDIASYGADNVTKRYDEVQSRNISGSAQGHENRAGSYHQKPCLASAFGKSRMAPHAVG